MSTQARILSALEGTQPRTAKGIQRQLGLRSPPYTTLSRMEKRGLLLSRVIKAPLDHQASPRDRKAYELA